jgi:cysteinyl-tRNA synthetase
MNLRLYNTATRSVDPFEPAEPPMVRLYTCGPTVYNYAHIGNLRTYVFEDVLVRVLRLCGWDVRRVMNVTDVGHLVSDADEGEDKMELGARREGRTVWEIAEYYWQAFRNDMHRLNLLEPEVWCKATEHIEAQIDLVGRLEAAGYTYTLDDGVYFDTSKWPAYGRMARLDVEGLKAGARVEMAAGKKNATDFALWKFSPTDKKRLMEWPSPWGVGFPGWHIECSAMAIHYLGEHLDIHCGGVDHVAVHHTNEIAQAEAALGHEWCRWWMHAEFLTLPADGGGGKMSKSTGEFLKLDLLADKGYEPLAYRYFLLGAHYRQQLAFSYEALDAAASAYARLKRAVVDLKARIDREASDPAEPIEDYWRPFVEAAADDLNMPRCLAAMWNCLKDASRAPQEVLATLLRMDEVLGLGIDRMESEAPAVDAEQIQRRIDERAQAKKDKDYARADAIRDELAASGIELMDSPQGTTWRQK